MTNRVTELEAKGQEAAASLLALQSRDSDGPEVQARLISERDAASTEATSLKSARDANLADVSRVTSDRDVARADVTRFTTERDAARAKFATSAQALQSAQAELVELRARALTRGGSSSQPGSSVTTVQLASELRTFQRLRDSVAGS